MSIELQMLVWTLVLAVVQIFLPAFAKTADYGLKWSFGTRDGEMPAPGKVTARLERAQRNLLETLPIFAAAILLVHATGRFTMGTTLGAQIYFWGRLVYIPIYAAGIPYLRSVVWGVAFAGLALVLKALLV